MTHLIAVTLLWAFSFSLIGVYLAGQVDPYFAVLLRIALACLVFAPFIRLQPLSVIAKLLVLGALQLGLMYLCYYQAFLLLSVPEVLIFTIFTPVYITLLYDMLAGKFHYRFLLAALLAVLAAAIMRYHNLSGDYWLGFLVVQGANICFAVGQVGYKVLVQQQQRRQQQPLQQAQMFGYFYLGALIVALPAWLMLGGGAYPQNNTQWLVLAWLGLVASGGGFFWWNKGATQVSSGVLAVMNNMLIPAGLLVNILIWNRQENIATLALGSVLLVLSCKLCQQGKQAGNAGVVNGKAS